MEAPPHHSGELERIYSLRFNAHLAYRKRVWEILTTKYFSRYVDADAAVLDLGCGYGEFISNISCGRKLGMDMNPAAAHYLPDDVQLLQQDCSMTWNLPAESLDVVFTSNFFEHLPSKRALVDTLSEACRCLRPGGRIIAMGPNIRYVGGAYWDFWDHHLALSDTSLSEALELLGFGIERKVPRFLPYTMVNRRRAPALFVALYLKCRPAWHLFGKQFLIIARKP